jgi:hypothetical protein
VICPLDVSFALTTVSPYNIRISLLYRKMIAGGDQDSCTFANFLAREQHMEVR